MGRRGLETLFVGWWGEFGPELYLVGRDVRRLASPLEDDRDAFARRILAEEMFCRPAARLARRFADAWLEPMSPDGFVLPKSDVQAWLDYRTVD
jgi:hypothetical protein